MHSCLPLRPLADADVLRVACRYLHQSVSTLRNSLQTKSNTVQAVQKQVERDQHHTDMAHLVYVTVSLWPCAHHLQVLAPLPPDRTQTTWCVVGLLSVRDFSSGFAREVQLPSPFFWQLLHLFEERMRRLGQQIALLEQVCGVVLVATALMRPSASVTNVSRERHRNCSRTVLRMVLACRRTTAVVMSSCWRLGRRPTCTPPPQRQAVKATMVA